MTRLRKGPSTDELMREYIYADPPISITALADKYGLARSGVAEKAKGQEGGKSWYQMREEFRRQLTTKSLDALRDKWAAFGTQTREKMMEAATKSLDAYMTDLAEGKVKLRPADAVMWVGVIRQLLADVENAARPDPDVIEGEAIEFDEARAAEVIAMVKALKDGKEAPSDASVPERATA